MKSKHRSFVRRVTSLVDADPTFVSLVSAGANGSPFNVVKQEKPTMGVKVKPRKVAKQGENAGAVAVRKNSNNRVGKARDVVKTDIADTRAITKFFYSKEEYDTEDSVREHIEKSDFEGGYEIEETDDQFVVTATDVDVARIAKSAVIETGDDGVTAEVSILKDAAAGDESEEDGEDDEEADDGEEDDDESSDDESTDDDSTGDDEDDGEEDDGEDGAEGKQPDQKSAQKKPAAKKTAAPAPVAKSKKAAFLEELAAEEDQDADEPVESKLQKFDFWEVYDSASSDFLTLLKDGCSDGLAPGYDDVMWTFGQSVRKTLAGDDDASTTLKKNADDFISVVIGMHELFSNIVNADMGVVAKADKGRADGLTKWAKSFGKELVAKVERSKPATTNTVNVAKSDGASAEDIASAVESAVAPLAAQLTAVTKVVDNIAQRRQLSKGIEPADGTTSEGAQPAPTKKTTTPAQDAATAAAHRIAKTVFAAQ